MPHTYIAYLTHHSSDISHKFFITYLIHIYRAYILSRVYIVRVHAHVRAHAHTAHSLHVRKIYLLPHHRCMFAYSLMCILIPLHLLNTFARSEHLTHRALNPLLPHHLRIFFSSPSYSEKIFLFTFHVTKKLLRPT